MSIFRLLIPAIGAGMAVAGLDKLAGERAYRRLFRHWGWSEQQMRVVGAVEAAGGALMVPARTRRLGGVLLAGASLAQLGSELRYHDDQLAAARTGVLLAALVGIVRPR